MNYTETLKLNKPGAADPMRLEDFNHNADLIDAALTEIPKIAVGTYTGDGSTDTPTMVDVGFAPKMVLVWCNWSDDSGTYNTKYCGMAIQGQSLQGILTLTNKGFQVKSLLDDSYQLYPYLNAKRTYFYFSIG